MEKRERKHLSYKKLLWQVRESFLYQSLSLPGRGKGHISTVDCLMSALAVFNYKWPSLLQYDEKKRTYTIGRNLKHLYQLTDTPSDTYMRERLDPVLPQHLRKAYKSIFAQVQRANLLEGYQYLEDSYLLSVDGTGQYLSKSIYCKNCCEKHHRDGSTSYYHQLLGAVIVHPDNHVVLPLAPEAILKGDGYKKNDCERNAAKRLLASVRREHPHLKLTVVEDALASNGPHIQLLRKLDMHYILGVKPKDHTFLFDWVRRSKVSKYEYKDEKEIIHRFHFINGVPLNDTYFDLNVNFLEYWEEHPNGKRQHFSWITDFVLSKDNVYQVMKGGRARWRIENETFNTLKNQGYHFEHNYGHGHENLFTVLSLLMMLAFLIDQVQMLASVTFQKAKKLAGSWAALWEDMRAALKWTCLESWEQLFGYLAYRATGPPD